MLRRVARRFSELEDMFANGIHRLPRENKPMPKRESLLLYRHVLKFSYEFDWMNERNENWGDKIRKSARSEFEAARFERDPLLVGQMIVTSREAITKVRERLIKKYAETHGQLLEGKFVFKEDMTAEQRRRNGGGEKDDNRGFRSDTYKD